jgi:ABC-2 type transport system permease protein
MMRTLGVCRALAGAAIRSEMQHRFAFITEVLFGLVYNSLGFLFIFVVLNRFDAMGGWSLGEVTLLYGIRLAGHGVWALVFANAMSIDYYVQQGEWDRLLIRPIPAFLQMMFINFRVAVFGDALAGAVVLVLGLSLTDVAWTPVKVLYLLAAIIGSAAIDGAFQVGPGALAFRYFNSEILRGNFEYLATQFGAYPLTILNAGTMYLLTYIIPLAFVAWVPGAVLLDRTGELPMPTWVAWSMPVIGVSLLALAIRIFLRESRHYQSAGS